MTKFADLTADQQTLVSLFVGPQFRPSVGQAARALNALKQLVEIYQINVQALIEGLEPGEPIPNETGLAGAQPLVKEDVVAFMTAADGLLAEYNTVDLRKEYAKIAGFPNTV